jgi:hypothetical protein
VHDKQYISLRQVWQSATLAIHDILVKNQYIFTEHSLSLYIIAISQKYTQYANCLYKLLGILSITLALTTF